MVERLRAHWPEYLMEAALLGLFMVSAGVFGTLLEHPDSPVRQALPSPRLRLALAGLAMGLTAVALIYSPWGRQSGAHFNPAVTLTFFRLGKIRLGDALFYVLAQFAGGILGVYFVLVLLGARFADAPVNYVATLPTAGPVPAFVAEALLAGGLMTMVLYTMNSARWMRWTGVFAGLLVAVYITVEAPISGMSINPARTLASAVPGRIWTSLWIYFTAPPLGMLLAVELHRLLTRGEQPHCAKLYHDAKRRCIFCGYLMPARSL
jgi:aquaporin Z